MVTDKNKTFEQEKSFTYRSLVNPNAISVLAESFNAENQVNSSNVKDAGIKVTFDGENTSPDSDEVVLVVTVTDKEDNSLELRQQLTKGALNGTVRGDLSSLEEGTLSLKAYLKDKYGNVSTTYTIPVKQKVNKLANAPEVNYSEVKRTAATSAEITDLKTKDATDIMHYLVKGIDEAVPSIDEVMKGQTITTAKAKTPGVVIPNEIGNDACVVYVVAQTTTGTKSENVLAIKVAKVGANPMEGAVVLQKVTSTPAKYSWTFDETTPGFVGYRVLLQEKKISGKTTTYEIKSEITVNKGETREVDFFDTLKKLDAGNYTVTVIAVADNEDYTDVTSNVESITTSAVLTNITVSLDKEEKTITWTPNGDVANVAGYKVEILKYDATKETNKEYTTVVSTETVADVTDYSIADIVERNGVGTYTFRVTAIAKDDVLMANKPSVAKNDETKKTSYSNDIKYHQGAAITNLSAELNNGEVTVKGKLLDATLFDGTPSITYTLYYKKASEVAYTNSVAIVPDGNGGFAQKLTALDSGSTYEFMVKTVVKDGATVIQEYETTNKVTITTAKEAIVVNSAKYVETKEGSSTVELDVNQITYSNGVLYYKDASKLHQYPADVYPEVANIVSALEQMTPTTTEKPSTDTISINGTVTALTLSAEDATVAKTYDLSQVPSTADVTITGNATYKTTVKGNLDEITLESDDEFDLSELTVDIVNVEQSNTTLTASADTTLRFGSSVGTSIVNGVTLTQATKLSDVQVTANGFEFTASANKLTVDASKATKNTNIEIDGNQVGLEIISNEQYAVSVNTNKSLVTDFVVKEGKVDLSDAKYGNLKVGTVQGPKKVILVTGKTLEETLTGQPVTTEPIAIKGLEYNMVASSANKATYEVNKTTGEITIEFNDTATATDYVIFSQTDGANLKVDSQSVENKVSTNHSGEPKLADNVKAIKDITVDGTTNTITVDFGSNPIKKYDHGGTQYKGEKHAWYEILIDTGIDRDNLASGTRYKIEDGDIEMSEKYAPDVPTKFLVYLWAEDEETIISFKEKDTGIEHFYTIKVVNADQMSEEE